MPAKFVLKKERSGKFRFQMLASNGKPVVTSELHGTKAGATRAMESLRKAASDATVDDQTTASATGRTTKKAAASKATSSRATGKKSASKRTTKSASSRSSGAGSAASWTANGCC